MNLVDKYNVPGPRYTSYPTVPFWDNPPSDSDWKRLVKASFDTYNDSDGVSIYIHLPYCESLCTFCGCNTRITVNHGVEEPYIEALLKEWELYTDLVGTEAKIKEIHLGGGTPTFFSPKNLAKLINGIKAKTQFQEHASFGFEANPKTTTYNHLSTMAKLGFDRLSLGIQDFDPLVQKTINRVQDFDQVNDVTTWARNLGYTSINYDLVYGLPYQTVQTIEHTIDMVNLLRPDRIAYYSYAHVPWVKPGQRSFSEKELPTPEVKHEMYTTGKDMLNDAGYIEIGMDHFALPEDRLAVAFRTNKLHRNFMGYTTQTSKLMIGLGVSSISDTWTSFGQNVKTVEEYLKRIEQGRFPIFRGHILNELDLQIRQLILDIMCHFKGQINSVLKEQLSEQPTLEELEKDRLIEWSDNFIRVTENGRPFVRNICMSFDQRLLHNKPDTQIFSMTV